MFSGETIAEAWTQYGLKPSIRGWKVPVPYLRRGVVGYGVYLPDLRRCHGNSGEVAGSH